MRSRNELTAIGNVATHKEDMRDGPPARLASDDVCSPDATFCDLRESMGNVCSVSVNRWERMYEHPLLGNPFERLGPDCRLAATSGSLQVSAIGWLDSLPCGQLQLVLRVESSAA